jgi:hypothetical protein
MSVPGPRREGFPVLDRLTYLNTASPGAAALAAQQFPAAPGVTSPAPVTRLAGHGA